MASRDQPFVLAFRQSLARLGFQYVGQGAPYFATVPRSASVDDLHLHVRRLAAFAALEHQVRLAGMSLTVGPGAGLQVRGSNASR
jgi:hypothetical protein